MSLELEPNDERNNATPLTLDTKFTGQLSSISDQDYFSIEVDGASTISVEFDSPIDSSLDYFNVYIEDSSGNILSQIETGSDQYII